ncbi:MAG: hypothetical protein IKF90_14720 [Parasporobacterium sp.]|nr:hypothetical protein [Parasporobacterium sp.]
MTDKELSVIVESFGTPCDYSPMDDYMHSLKNWCDRNCGKVKEEHCWRKYIKEKLKERKSDG